MSQLVSIVTPAENNEKYINEALESLKQQSYSHIEVLILHSDIHALTNDIDQTYIDDPAFKYIETPKNINVSAARNLGIDHAKGKYVYFFDSDDYLLKETIEILYRHTGDSPIVAGKMEYVDFSANDTSLFPTSNEVKRMTQDRFKLLNNNSALNYLISKEYIDDLNLRFSEEYRTFSDLTLMVPLFEKVKELLYVKNAVYCRRQRNNPINHPSLRQLDTQLLAEDLFDIYEYLKSTEVSDEAEYFLDYKLINFYRKRLIPIFRKESNIDYFFHKLSKNIKSIDINTIKQQDMRLKREVTAIKTGIKVYKFINKIHNLFRTVFRETGPKYGKKGLLYKLFFSRLKLKNNLVVFESFQGKSYSDSPRYIYQHMLKERKNYHFIWVNNAENRLPGQPKTVKRSSLKYYYYIARAKYIVTNVRMPNNYIKRQNQIYLQTWHGTPLKRLAGDVEDIYMPGTNSAKYKRNFNRETNKWDYLIAPNQYSADIFERAFWFDHTILKTGYPRNDILMNNNDSAIIHGLKNRLKLPVDKKVILYAPTWRDDEFYKVGKYRFSLKLDLHRMKEELGDDYIIILRMHYVVASNMDLTGLEGFAYDFSKYEDVSELYLLSDMLITDYSSVFFDYANLQRPILFFTYDLDKYQNQLRGFYIDMETELPGPLLKTNDEVLDAIQHIHQVENDYAERYQAFYDRFCRWDDGMASEKVVKAVFNH